MSQDSTPPVWSLQYVDHCRKTSADGDLSWLSLPPLVDLYANAGCYYLAIVLNRRCNLPLASLIDAHGEADWHAFVMVDDQLALDIKGIRPVQDIVDENRRRWGRRVVGYAPATESTFDRWWAVNNQPRTHKGDQAMFAHADDIASVLLQKYNLN